MRHVFCINTTVYTKGFTLVEALVAITLLLLVVVGPLTIAQKGIQNAAFAQQQTTAVFLAQEAIESVQYLRDQNALEEFDAYMTNIAGGGTGAHNGDTMKWYKAGAFPDIDDAECKVSNGCDYNATDGTFHSCTSSTGCTLKVQDSTGKYGYGNIGWTPSPYTRVITLRQDVDGNVAATVKVSWKGPGVLGDRSVTIQTWIYDQYQRYE